MSRTPVRMPVFDPYFDTDGSGNLQAPSPQSPQASPLPGGDRYQHPSAVRLSNDRTAMDLMRPGPRGLVGVVIPHATPGGIPAGARPHAIREMEINIDPHIEGQSAVLRLADVNPQAMRQATDLAAHSTPEVTDMATQRLRGSAVLHGLAALSQTAGQAPQAAAPAGYLPSPNLGRTGTIAQRQVTPLQSFLQGSQSPPGREQRQIDLGPSVVQPPRQAAAEPQFEVEFQIRGFGRHTAYFHDVLVEPGFIVLVYKTHYRGAKWFPPPASEPDAPDMAMNIIGTPVAYLVQTTGVQYVYADSEHCVLMVTQAAQLPADAGQE
jgi:hypothetical protein